MAEKCRETITERFHVFVMTIYSVQQSSCVQLGLLYRVRIINTVGSQFNSKVLLTA